MFNTDQGSQFTSLEFTQVLQDRGVKISMDGKGRYQDNIFAERLWRTVKNEEVYLKADASVLEAQRGLEDYFRFYNGLRPHQALGYRTPAEVFYGEQEAVAEESDRNRCSPAVFRNPPIAQQIWELRNKQAGPDSTIGNMSHPEF